MILVFGGTTEGKQVADTLNKLQLPFLYSTKTKTNGVIPQLGRCIHGALDENAIKSLCHYEQIDLIIDAAHPFAVNLHQTVASSARTLSTSLVRYERVGQERLSHPLVRYVTDYNEAVLLLQKLGNPSLLALSGVQSIPKLTKYWRDSVTYFRILDRPESKVIADQNHFPRERLILGYPSESLAQEVSLYSALNIKAILTKESGHNGGQAIKIKAAIKMNIPAIIIKKPLLPDCDFTVSNTVELNQLLTKMAAE